LKRGYKPVKKNLFAKRIFSIIIAVALLVSAVPISLALQDMIVEETTSKIVREVTELREESVKHFLCEDGSYIAATYSAPVHYKENGEWKEIDNRLSLDRTTLSESGKPTYTTKAGGLSVSIPQSFSDGQKITAQNKGYKIEFGINSTQNDVSLKTSASVVELDTLSSNTEVAKLNTVKSINNVSTVSTLDSNDIESYNAEIMTVDNQSSAVTYKEIMPDTDFEYIVTSNSIKENIVVYEPQSEYIYNFDMDFDGLTPVINPDNSISLIEPNNPDETIFFIEAPYMYDSNNEESIDIEMSLVSNGDEYVMTLVANADWINDPERVFPVVIDPTIQLLNSNINDVFVINGLYANSPRVKNEIRVGRNLTNITRTYVKITLPTIPTASVITDANFTLTMDYFYREMFEDDIDIKVYDCRNVAEWSPDTVSWNNQPFGNSANSYKSKGAECLDYIFASGSKTKFVFDITNAVQRWYDTGVNKGLMFASSDENANVQVDFHSSRVSDSANRPTMTFTYLPSGVNTSNVTFDAASGTSQLITVTSSKEWLITTNQSWITTTPSSGTGTASFVINVSENTSVEPRTGIVLISSGGSVIGTVNVTQLGAASKVIVEKENLLFDSQGDSQIVSVVSNTSWNVLIEESAQNWLSVEKNTSGNIIIKASEYNGEGHREGKITVKTNDGNDSKEITIKQLDYVDFYFNEIDSDGNIAYKNSSEYNHSLATWAMKLSYAAYNYPQGGDLPDIPGNFMGNVTEPVTQIFADLGFTNYQDYNYDESNNVAHVIAHRNIEFTQEVEGVLNDVYGYNVDYSGIGNAVVYTVTDGTGSTVSHSSPGDLAGESSNLQVSTEGTDNIRPLVVVSVRGSVSILDWIMNLCTQLHMCLFDFETGRDMVLKSLYGCDGNCFDCIGTGNRCEGYLEKNNISDPIILVTGHSMGAAVANLVAAELNEIEGTEDVYGYTFATPYVKAYPLDTVITQPDNIFNILNTNDVVTYVPTSWLLPGTNIWSRYGIDIPLNMPYSEEQESAKLGLYSHSMAVYMKWMETHPNMTYEAIMAESAEAKTRGLLPWIVKIKCPVSVSVRDINGNLIAYESQEEGVTYPEVTDTGIVSWITDNGEKMFFIPSGVDVASVDIESYDYGSMDFAVGTAGTINESEIKVFNDVSLYPGKEFLVEVSEDTLPEDTQLFITENGEIVGEVTETEPHLKSVTVEHEEKDGYIVTYKNFVTDNTVTEIRYIYEVPDNNVTATSYLTPDSSVVTIVEDGNNLIWTRGDCYLIAGDYFCDVVVKSGDEWFTYDNAFVIHITEEMAATNQEYYSSVLPQSSTNEFQQTYQVNNSDFILENDINNCEIPYIESL
jgi:hypothetical protein